MFCGHNRALSLQLVDSTVSAKKSAVSVTVVSFSECNFPTLAAFKMSLFFGFLQFY